MLTSAVLCAFLAASPSLAQVARRSNPSTSAHIDKGTFENPSVHVRPKFRYWLPDASVDIDVVASDVKAAKDVGMGGLELLGYYLYGGPPSNGAGRGLAAPVDWATYGFGTQAWYDVFRAFVEATKDNNLIMDFAIGPNQGTGVPAIEDSDGLMWDLAAFNVSVPLGGSFHDILPGWGTGKLQAAVTALAVDATDVVRLDELAPDPGSLPGDLSLNRTQVTLSAASLQDVSAEVGSDGHLSVNFAGTNTSGINHTVFAIYLIHSDYRAQDGPLDLGGPQTAPTSWRQNGSWSVDHFSALGAKTTTNFWEKYILANGTRQLVMEVGNYAWEDSIEIDANVYWTKYFAQDFRVIHGYGINKWLPILFHRNGHYENSNPSVWWVTDEPDHGNGHIADYRATLAKGYQAYLTGLNEWAERYLNLQASAQISYNLPMDMLENIPYVDAPECESLDFSDLIDGYRQYSGPANLAERRIVSSECGAVKGEGFVQTLPELMWKAKRSYAGSIRQFVFHGMPYSGDYGNTTWPVFTTFNYQYSEMHGPNSPAWAYYSDQMDFVARNNWVLQTGVPKVDIAIWQKVTTYPGHIELRTYEPTDLEDMGYIYEYLSPNNFDLPAAKVVGAVLAPDAQGFKAMVVRANDSMTVEGVSKLAEFAHAGLPIVFAGGTPSSYVGTYNPMTLRKSNRTLQGLQSLPNVHVTDDYLVASTLASLGITPRTKITAITPGNATWFTTWRSDKNSSTDYVFVYNDAMYIPQGEGASEGTIEFESTGVPYEYDAWTGEQKPILAYNATNGSTIIPLNLAGNQSTIIAFHGSTRGTNTTHLAALDDNVVGYTYAANGSAILQIAETPSTTLSNWTLVAEHWDPPANLYNISGGAYKHNTTHYLPSLVSWRDIPGLQNVSGRGYYSTTFNWSPSSMSGYGGSSAVSGACLDFGWVYHTLQVWLNGHRLPPLDVTAPKVDVKEWLIAGQNKVEAVVSTPLGNVLIPIWYQLQTSGEGPGSPDASTVPPPVGNYGLQADVKLIPYVEKVVS